jgi:hypothetical protein
MSSMSRTHKIQRTRRAHAASKAWRVAFNRSRPEAKVSDQERTQALAELDAQAVDPHQAQDRRTSGKRYGNQRKFRAAARVTARRKLRKQAPDPMQDAFGDAELPARPRKPSRGF